jgi:hypothetical protein
MTDPLDTKARELLLRLEASVPTTTISERVAAIRRFAEEVAREALGRVAQKARSYCEERQWLVNVDALVHLVEDEAAACRLTPPEPKTGPTEVQISDRWNEEADRALESTAAAMWLGASEWIACVESVAAALRGAYAEGARDRIDSAFQNLIANLVPYLDAQSMHAVHAECAKIEERLAAPARLDAALARSEDAIRRADELIAKYDHPPQPSGEGGALEDGGAGEPCNVCGSERCVDSGHVPLQPAPVTYRAGTVPGKIVVGMVLRKEGGALRTVADATGEWIMVRDAKKQYWNALREDVERWPLARDWTEAGGGEACPACDGAGWVWQVTPDHSIGDTRHECDTCNGTGRTK